MMTTFFELVGVLLAAVVVFVVVPRIIFPLHLVPGTAFDRVMAGIVFQSAYTCAAMYLLGSVGALETFAIIASWVLCWYVFKGRKRRKGGVARMVEGVFAVSDRLEQQHNLVPGRPRQRTHVLRDVVPRETLRQRTRSWLARLRDAQPPAGEIVLRIAVLVVLVISAVLRFERSWSHVELVPQDSYLALSWTTFINQGRLLADGIYPQGAYLSMSLVDRFYPGDVYTAVRFLGPLMATFELLVLYWVVSRAARSRAAGLLALVVFGFFAGHPDLLVTWVRQIGSMTNEYAIAFGLLSIVYAGRYLWERQNLDLVLAGCALFMAVTSNTLVLPLIVIGYLAIGITGLVTGAVKPVLKIALWSFVALLASNYYMLLGFFQGNTFVRSFRLYQPGSERTFGEDPRGPTRGAGFHLANNELYLTAFIGTLVALAIGLLAWRRHKLGQPIVVLSLTVLLTLVFHDFVSPEFGLLFRTRMAWMAGALIPVGIGLGLGSITAVVVGADWKVRERRPLLNGLAFAGLAVVAISLAMLWPRQDAIAREAFPSGYPQATKVSLEILRNERRNEFTMVGVSEQYQEVLAGGFFVEAWVFARDVTMTDAADPNFDLPIPTNRIYIFAEKVTFPGPESPPAGPTQEYYRDLTKRERLMQRILLWSETYRQHHADMTVIYDDPELRVYKVDRKVDIQRANDLPQFKDYRWEPGKLFSTDADITADRIDSDPESGVLIEHA